MTHRDLIAIINLAWRRLELDAPSDFNVVRARNRRGDWTSNVALAGAKDLKMAPAELARLLVNEMSSLWPGTVEEANGFLNFAMDDDFLKGRIALALEQGDVWGAGDALRDERVVVEFVSAEPSGALPFSSARTAAMGDALCRLLTLQGANVTREFFINDALSSSKTRLLGESVSALYLAQFGHDSQPPEGALDDEFARRVARDIASADGNAWVLVPESERVLEFARRAVRAAVALQKQTLQIFGVHFDVWTSEQALRDEGRVEAVINRLRERGHAYERDGALWLRTTQWGDAADRPLVRPAPESPEGKPTYLATDIAYHIFKLERGFDRLINIWTAEHGAYVARTRAALQAASCEWERVEVLLCEGARWLRDGTPVRRGKNSDAFTLDEALSETDRDTLCFWMLNRDWKDISSVDSETARRDDETNLAYAARLLPSRLDTLIRELEARTTSTDEDVNAEWNNEEREVARLVALWPDTALTSALEREPQRVARFVTEMATAVRALLMVSRPASTESTNESNAARLQLLRAARITANNALRVVGMTVGKRV